MELVAVDHMRFPRVFSTDCAQIVNMGEVCIEGLVEVLSQ
jgi:hypothetical protein